MVSAPVGEEPPGRRKVGYATSRVLRLLDGFGTCFVFLPRLYMPQARELCLRTLKSIGCEMDLSKCLLIASTLESSVKLGQPCF